MPIRLSLFLYVFLCIISTDAKAQELIGFSVIYGDSFMEWEVIPADEAIDIGNLNLSWPDKRDWTDWEYNVAGRVGNIHQKWINRPHEWELIDGEYVVSIRNQWKGDLTIWKITCDDYNLKFESRYNNIADEWTLTTKKHGSFEVYTNFEGDPRDWIVEDRLDEDFPLALKMAMIYISIYYSVPHR